jgi:hypothetical protein
MKDLIDKGFQVPYYRVETKKIIPLKDFNDSFDLKAINFG